MSYRYDNECGARCLGASPPVDSGCDARCLGSFPRNPSWMPSTAMLPHGGRIPRGSRGRQVFMEHSTGLGFSFKPPKWLRKAQPGKILQKAAVPIAIGAGALLIPGVGGALVGAAAAAAKGAGGLISAGKSLIGTSVSNIVTQIPGSLTTTPINIPAMFSTTPSASPNPAIVPPPQVGSGAPMVQSDAGQSAAAPAGPGGEAPGAAGEMPSWLLPAGIAAALFLFGGGLAMGHHSKS